MPDISIIKDRRERAAPGDWTKRMVFNPIDQETVAIGFVDGFIAGLDLAPTIDFIVNSKADIDTLLARIDELEKKLAEKEEMAA